MNVRITGTLVAKDFSLYFRNRFFAVITLIGLAFYLLVYFVMPRSVDETLKIGILGTAQAGLFRELEGEGIQVQAFADEEALKVAVREGAAVSGVVFPADVRSAGSKIRLYVARDLPQEVRDAVDFLLRELMFMVLGDPLPLKVSEVLVGPDMAGTQIAPRDRLRPLFAVLLIMMEMLGLGNLIAEEIEHRTIHALLATPVQVSELFTAKAIMGVGLAFFQAVLFMAIVGGFARRPLVSLVALLLGALLATGIGFIIAALGKNMMSVMSWGFPILIVLFIPTFGVAFPGSVTTWVKFIPSYYLVDTVHRAASFGSGWVDLWPNLIILLAFDVVFVSVGLFALWRKSR